jgi:asparagine synthase (glutamine-hydrolysing)
MCSILGILDIKSSPDDLRNTALELSRLMRHRGPDWSGIFSCDHAILAHERLAIVDVESGEQPLYSPDRTTVLAVNGEIYNHFALQQSLDSDYQYQTRSDCEVILALYEKHGSKFVDMLHGMFAFCLYDTKSDRYLIARDHMGIIPLYLGYDGHGNRFVSSELKALAKVCNRVEIFPPGHYLDSHEGQPTRYYQRDWQTYDNVRKNRTNRKQLRASLESSVRSHLMSDVPYGVLLSGGLDSSVISAIASKFSQRRIEDEGQSAAWWPRLHSFAIGLAGSPDLAAAQLVAGHIGTVHHSLTFTVQEGLDALRDVIYHIETYDVTSIRASTPMYLMARKIKAAGIKMVLSGEGADEIFGGYLYFHKAPNAREFHEELVRKLAALHLYDCNRANKAMAAWGVEARVPFLDKDFLDVAMRINPDDKMCRDGRIEKQVLRECFADYLPESVAWRQKEQFSDGVGYLWIDSLKKQAASRVSDRQLENASFRFPVNTPDSKEAYMYRELFEEHFGNNESVLKTVPFEKSVACSTARALEWDEAFRQMNEPSGRAVGVHREALANRDRQSG